jgi:preprotein translocase subunit SecG
MITTLVTIIFVLVSIFMILAILMQAGKGGGMGSALGGGASQSVFGGGGGADVMAKITQGFATAFMVCAIYLAYASSHSGSDFLQDQSEVWEDEANLATEDGEVDYERVAPSGNRALALPTKDRAATMRASAAAAAPASTPIPTTPG